MEQFQRIVGAEFDLPKKAPMAMTAAYLDRPSTHFDEAAVDVNVDVECNLGVSGISDPD